MKAIFLFFCVTVAAPVVLGKHGIDHLTTRTDRLDLAVEAASK